MGRRWLRLAENTHFIHHTPSHSLLFVTFPTMPIDPPIPNGEGEGDKLEFNETEESCLLDKTCGDEEDDGEA